MRTSPPYGPAARVGSEGWRPAADGGRLSLLAPPGSYTVKLSAGGSEFVQPLTVRKDPHSAGAEVDIDAQMKTLFELRGDVESAADVVNGIELVRAQIDALVHGIDDALISNAGRDLNQKLIALELQLIELRATGRGGEASKLLSKIVYLANEVGSADFKPTNQQLEVQKLLEQRLEACQRQINELRTGDLTAFNDLLRNRNIPHIATKAEQPMGRARDEHHR